MGWVVGEEDGSAVGAAGATADVSAPVVAGVATVDVSAPVAAGAAGVVTVVTVDPDVADASAPAVAGVAGVFSLVYFFSFTLTTTPSIK